MAHNKKIRANREVLILYNNEIQILEKYIVENLSVLKFNFSGILMQEDEEYGNMVWDKHFGSLYEKLELQKKSYQLSGVINPFAAVQSLSMAYSGTDMYHHLHFLKEAENYRRIFIKTLNDEYAFGGSKTCLLYTSDAADE